MPFIDPSQIPPGAFRTTLHATQSTTIAVPGDLFGGVYNTDAAALAANSAMGNVDEWSVYGILLSGPTTAARTLTFTSRNSDGTAFDQKPYVATLKSGLDAGDYVPFGGPGGLGFGVTRGDLGGGFAVVANHAEVIGSLYWTPRGSY